MYTEKPGFFDNEYFVAEPGNWHLKEGAPQEVIDEFNEYMGQRKEGTGFLKAPERLPPKLEEGEL